MSSVTGPSGILDHELASERQHIIELLTRAYWMEVETVMNYLAASVNPDGVRARRIAASLAEDVEEELGHARQFAQRIKELYGVVPSSVDFAADQQQMRPPNRQTEIQGLIEAVIAAESEGIVHYNRIIRETDGLDPVTQDMTIAILHDEERHRRLFEGFLREYQNDQEGTHATSRHQGR